VGDVVLTALKVLVALAAAVGLYQIGAFCVRSFWFSPPPPNEPPEPSELTPVHYEYRCTVCGATVVMTAAPSEDIPDPPRHCREDMRLVVEAE
jgi:hypothetical protein